MKPSQIKSGQSHILYDAELPVQAEPALFDAEAWRRRGLLLGSARGRGEAAIVRLGEHEFVLRHYRRGGLPGRFINDRYLWTGLERSRAFREWHLTAELYRRGLPVPRPVAARVEREGPFYRADLLTVRIPQARSLAEALAGGALPADVWRRVGACLRRFHDAGLDHADLNAHNILLTVNAVYVIDLDRGRLREPGNWSAGNLRRLHRSLDKLARQQTAFAFMEADWDILLVGYGAQNVESAAT